MYTYQYLSICSAARMDTCILANTHGQTQEHTHTHTHVKMLTQNYTCTRMGANRYT
jgi:hypothetical protein